MSFLGAHKLQYKILTDKAEKMLKILIGFLSGLQFLDSDDSSLWSSSTETTNVDERASLTDFQHSNSTKTGNINSNYCCKYQM